MASQRLSPLERTRDLLALDRGDLGVVVLYGIGVGLISLAVPVAVQALVNTVAFGALLQPVVVLTLLVAVVLGAGAALRALQIRIIEMMQRRLFVRMSHSLSQRLPQVPQQSLQGRRGPELLNRFFDVFTAQKSLASLVVDSVDAVLVAFVGMILLATYHPLLLAFDVVLIVLLVLVFFFFGRGGTPSAVAESAGKYAMAAWLEEMARLPVLFRSNNAQRFANERADALAHNYLARRDKHFRLVFRQVVGALALEAAASVALLGLGATLVIERQLTLGQLVAAELVVAAVVASMAKLGQKIESYYDLLAAVDKLGVLLDLPVRPGASAAEGPVLPEGEPLELQFVAPAASGRDAESVWLRVAPGEALGVTGTERETAAFLERLLGSRRSGAEYVRVGGCDTRELSEQIVRSRVGLVQEPEIIPASVAENIRIGAPDATTRGVSRALELAGIGEAVRKLPDGMHTSLDASGRPLTYSEALQISVARALAGGVGVLVLDRTFDRMAPEVRFRAATALLGRRNVTLVIIGHEPSTLKNCDKILDLEKREVRQPSEQAGEVAL